MADDSRSSAGAENASPTALDLALATGLRYRVLRWHGPGETTFVLVHGFADLAYTWHEVAPALLVAGEVIAPDLRGHGDSDRVGGGGYYHFLDYVADLDDVISQLARPKVVLVGHSMGGMISAYYAGTRPDRVAALVLIEGLGPPDLADSEGPSRTAAWIDAWQKAREKRRRMASLEDAVHRLCRADERLDPELARRLAVVGTRVIDGSLEWKLDPLHNTIGPYPFRVDSARRYWQRITCPVLCIDGTDSKLNLSREERAQRRSSLRDVTVLDVDAAGHAVQRHQPAKLAEAILAFAGRPAGPPR